MSDYYEIRIRGHVDGQQFPGLEGGLIILHTDEGETILSGSIQDQAALHGVLAQIRDLALPLLAVSSFTAAEDSNVAGDEDIQKRKEEKR